jgi:hypothetical protein
VSKVAADFSLRSSIKTQAKACGYRIKMAQICELFDDGMSKILGFERSLINLFNFLLCFFLFATILLGFCILKFGIDFFKLQRRIF